MKHSTQNMVLAAKVWAKILMLALAVVSAAPAAWAQVSSVKAKSDSTTLTMGDRVTVNVEVVRGPQAGALVGLPEKGKDYFGMEMIDCVADSADLGNDRTQVNYRFTFQAFDPSELLTLPGFAYACAGDTVVSDILTFKVLPVELSPELGDINDVENLQIHPMEQVVSIPSKWYDFIPDWWIWVLVGLIAAGLCVVVYLLYKRNGPKLFVPKRVRPPYEIAVDELSKLRSKQLIEKGMGKQFYTEVTEIWRKYLHGRFGINAMEMTSSQILKQLRSNKETHLPAKQMDQILQISDYVKFAALNPSREEMERTFSAIQTFVEDTRPAPAPEEENKIHKS